MLVIFIFFYFILGNIYFSDIYTCVLMKNYKSNNDLMRYMISFS